MDDYDEHMARIAACDTHFYESSSSVGLSYYRGNTDEERLQSLVNEFLVATKGAKSIAVTPLVYTALVWAGIDTTNCVVDPFQRDTTATSTIDDIRGVARQYLSG